jgi:hypothetical protein
MSNAYDPDKCDAFEYNMDSPFDVPAKGEWRKTIDCSYCGGFVQNYQIVILTDRRRMPTASLAVYDQTGARVGQPGTPKNLCAIGSVPADAIYTVVVTSGGKKERCIMFCSGGI